MRAVTIDSGIMVWTALAFIIGTALLWIRVYARSRQPGWLLMAGGVILPAQGFFLSHTDIWVAAGGLLLFTGSLMVCASLREAMGKKKP